MHVAILDVPISDGPVEPVCYGPFADELALAAWWDLITMTLDLGIRKAARYPVGAPFDLTDDPDHGPVVEPGEAAKVQQALPGADENAAGFVVRLSDPVTDQGGVVGAFGTRDAATAWWQAQAPFMDPDTVVHVLPILEP